MKAEAAEAEADPSGSVPADSASNTAVTRHPTEDPDTGEPEVVPKEGGPGGSTASAKEAAKEPHPPAKRYRMTDSMKAIVWTLVSLSNEHCRLENEKQCVWVFFGGGWFIIFFLLVRWMGRRCRSASRV